MSPIERAYLYEIAQARLVQQAAEARLRALKAQSALQWFEGLGACARQKAQRQRQLKQLQIPVPASWQPPSMG